MTRAEIPLPFHTLHLGAACGKGGNMEEVWKAIDGYEERYQISNLGRVRSLDQLIPYETYGVRKLRKVPGRILKLHQNETGYMTIDLWKDTIKKRYKVHRLVAETFIPNPKMKKCVNHKDGDKGNNCVDNLEWVTHSENMHHAVDQGLWVSWNKGKHPTGTPRSEETKEKISNSLKGNTHHKGKPHSEATKKKISDIKKAYYKNIKLSQNETQ